MLPRSVKLAGASNFRDLGGYVGHQGRQLKWRRLFRSDHLAALSPQDVLTLENLGVSRVMDFRGLVERETLACALPSATVHSLAIEPTVVQGMKDLMDAGQVVTPELTQDLMRQTYRDFVLGNSARFADLFGHLLEHDGPLVFHCTAGKDRTGFAAAMILTALGVAKEVVMQDYLLTNTLYKMPTLTQSALPQEVMSILWRVQEGFLDAAFEVVDAEFGGLQPYLQDHLGLDALRLERLRELYLQKE
jgi:protein-tyrosine phosphatase